MAVASAQVSRDTLPRKIDSLVVQAGRSPTAVGGASALVVRPEALAYPPPPTPVLGDVLRQIPFVLVRQNSRGENEISMRGSDSRQAAVLVDGIPLTLGWDHRLDPSLVPLTGIRQLTVTRGLSSVLGGPNVLGGMIEFGFADPAADASRRTDLVAATGVDTYGSRSLTVAGGTRVSTTLGQLTVRGGATARHRDGFALPRPGSGDAAEGLPDPGQDGEGRLRTNSDLRETDAFAALRLQSAGGRHVGLTLTGFDAERGVPAELHIASPRLWRYPDVSRRLAILSAGTGVVATPAGNGSLTASVGLNTGTLEIATYADAGYTTVTAREYGDERTLTARALATHSLGGAGQVRASYTFSGIRYDERFDDDPASRYRQELHSAAVESEWSLGGTARLSAGLVHDRASTPETGGRPPLGELSRTGWRLGASTLGISDAVRFHLSLSRRSRFPALRELYSGSLNRFDPNPGLRPETLLGAELGATVLGGALAQAGVTLQAVAFHHRLDDAVVRVTLPDRKFRRINRDEMRSTGLELVLDWVGGPRNGSSPRGPTLTADLLLQRVRLYDQTLPAALPNARRAEHQPELRAALDAGVPLPLALRGLAGLHYSGRQYCQHPDRGEQVSLGGQGVLDLAVTREWDAGNAGLGAVRLVLAVDNVADASVYDQCGLPQPGRTIRMGVELR